MNNATWGHQEFEEFVRYMAVMHSSFNAREPKKDAAPPQREEEHPSLIGGTTIASLRQGIRDTFIEDAERWFSLHRRFKKDIYHTTALKMLRMANEIKI